MYSCVDNGYIQPYPMTDYSYSGMEQELGTNHSRKSKRRRVTTPVQRKAANVRERKRMFSLNDAFDKLRKVSCRLSHNSLNLNLVFCNQLPHQWNMTFLVYILNISGYVVWLLHFKQYMLVWSLLNQIVILVDITVTGFIWKDRCL